MWVVRTGVVYALDAEADDNIQCGQQRRTLQHWHALARPRLDQGMTGK
jgi:hypothetical protein